MLFCTLKGPGNLQQVLQCLFFVGVCLQCSKKKQITQKQSGKDSKIVFSCTVFIYAIPWVAKKIQHSTCIQKHTQRWPSTQTGAKLKENHMQPNMNATQKQK